MEQIRNPENSIKYIEIVADVTKANELLSQGWIYLGFYRGHHTEAVGDTHITEDPVFVLGTSSES